MKPLEKMVLSKKDKNLINDYITDIVHKLNCDLKIKFDWFKCSYYWFSNDLVKVEYEQDGTVRNEDSVWRKYKKLKDKISDYPFLLIFLQRLE